MLVYMKVEFMKRYKLPSRNNMPWLLLDYFDAFVNIINSVSDEKRKTRLIKA